MRHNNNQEALDILLRLRQAVASLHSQLDSQLPIAKPLAQMADYLQHIQLFYRWLSAIQNVLSNYAGLSLDYLAQNQQSLAWMRQDLEAAGMVADSASLPFTLEQSPAAAWGVQYVIEGSYLGANVLHRRFSSLQSASNPMKFFRERAKDGASRWQQFRRDIALAVAYEQDMQVAEKSAVQAFEYFALVMSPPHHQGSHESR